MRITLDMLTVFPDHSRIMGRYAETIPARTGRTPERLLESVANKQRCAKMRVRGDRMVLLIAHNIGMSNRLIM